MNVGNARLLEKYVPYCCNIPTPIYILNALCPNIQKSWRETEHLKIKIDILICMISNSFFVMIVEYLISMEKTVLNS